MKIEFTAHALRRMRERNLNRRQVKEFIGKPDSVEISKKASSRFLIKKRYHHRKLGKDHLLMAICERAGDTLVVVTIIDTSQVKKYSWRMVKIGYDKAARILSFRIGRGKSVDSDVQDNVVIDRDKEGRIVNVEIMDVGLEEFKKARSHIRKLPHLDQVGVQEARQ